MLSSSHFLALPCELRDMIYHHYLYDVGYRFDFESHKLRMYDGRPIDLALMYTCTFIADEMRGLALRINQVIFTPVNSESKRLKAARYNWSVNAYWSVKAVLLNTLLQPGMTHHLNLEALNEILAKYPDCKAYFPINMAEWDTERRGELCFTNRLLIPKSTFSAFQDDLIKSLLEYSPSFLEDARRYAATYYTGGREIPDKNTFLNSSLPLWRPNLWEIPSDDEVSSIGKYFDFYGEGNALTRQNYNFNWVEFKWSYSAAAAAISFLQSLRESVRLQFRSILLDEKEPSILDAECHGLGLIPFCRENSRLRIERRISLWRNAFVDLPKLFDMTDYFGCGNNVLELYLTLPPFSKRDIGFFILPWIKEAVELPAAGMPTFSFCLTFQGGDELSSLTAQVGDAFKLDFAWHCALDRGLKEGSVEKFQDGFSNELVPLTERVIQEITKVFEGTSFIKCDFLEGELLHDPAKILKDNFSLRTLGDWEDEWMGSFGDDTFDISSFLARNWRDVRVDPSKPLELPSNLSEESREYRLTVIEETDNGFLP